MTKEKTQFLRLFGVHHLFYRSFLHHLFDSTIWVLHHLFYRAHLINQKYYFVINTFTMYCLSSFDTTKANIKFCLSSSNFLFRNRSFNMTSFPSILYSSLFISLFGAVIDLM